MEQPVGLLTFGKPSRDSGPTNLRGRSVLVAKIAQRLVAKMNRVETPDIFERSGNSKIVEEGLANRGTKPTVRNESEAIHASSKKCNRSINPKTKGPREMPRTPLSIGECPIIATHVASRYRRRKSCRVHAVFPALRSGSRWYFLDVADSFHFVTT